jgi:hypothetical protein
MYMYKYITLHLASALYVCIYICICIWMGKAGTQVIDWSDQTAGEYICVLESMVVQSRRGPIQIYTYISNAYFYT